MAEARWKTIDKMKLEADIDRLATRMDAVRGEVDRTKDVAMAVNYARLAATHDALVSVFNSLN